MGAGASSDGGELEQLVACTYLLGQALASMSFPDMYRVQDFHAADAPKLQSASNGLLGGVSEPPISQADGSVPVFDYGSRFNVLVGGERVVVDDPALENEDGWTSLHACCHSQGTVAAALAIVEEFARRKAGFEAKTRRGPGAYNAGWTALHMAAAYGVEPVVSALVDGGADVRCRNSLGWTPLMEACHRGFDQIVEKLLKAPGGTRDLGHVPDADDARKFPFARPPPQSALGEASRCGFVEIAQRLMDEGAPKDLPNSIGWTPLHEAAFYNHLSVARALLVYGADATLRDTQDALPYHVASLASVRDVIAEMGGAGAAEARLLDAAHFQFRFGEDPDVGRRIGSAGEAPVVAEGKDDGDGKGGAVASAAAFERDRAAEAAAAAEAPVAPEFLHRGEKLGELPALSPTKGRGAAADARRMSAAVENAERRTLSPTSAAAAAADPRRAPATPARAAPPSGGAQTPASPPANTPQEFLCAISRRILKEPMVSPYGHVFECKVIRAWFAKNGSVCPLTGQPLVESELRFDDALKTKITNWEVTKSLAVLAASPPDDANAKADLYDF